MNHPTTPDKKCCDTMNHGQGTPCKNVGNCSCHPHNTSIEKALERTHAQIGGAARALGGDTSPEKEEHHCPFPDEKCPNGYPPAKEHSYIDSVVEELRDTFGGGREKGVQWIAANIPWPYFEKIVREKLAEIYDRGIEEGMQRHRLLKELKG